jgi:hypothetical protein
MRPLEVSTERASFGQISGTRVCEAVTRSTRYIEGHTRRPHAMDLLMSLLPPQADPPRTPPLTEISRVRPALQEQPTHKHDIMSYPPPSLFLQQTTASASGPGVQWHARAPAGGSPSVRSIAADSYRPPQPHRHESVTPGRAPARGDEPRARGPDSGSPRALPDPGYLPGNHARSPKTILKQQDSFTARRKSVEWRDRSQGVSLRDTRLFFDMASAEDATATAIFPGYLSQTSTLLGDAWVLAHAGESDRAVGDSYDTSSSRSSILSLGHLRLPKRASLSPQKCAAQTVILDGRCADELQYAAPEFQRSGVVRVMF